MRFIQLVCVVGALASTLDAGTIVFGNISCSYPGSTPAGCINESSNGADSVENAGPLYDSFTSAGAPGTITDLQLILSADDTSDAVQVGLYADNSTTPGGLITLLGSVNNIAGTPALYDITLTASPELEADTPYWIGISGLSGATNVYWSFDSDDSGTGVAGENFSNQGGVFPDVDGPYQMQVTESSTPEPASVFLITAAAGVWAMLRRRTA